MGERTVLTRATSKSDSLRTTVPRGIVKQLDIQERDLLEWRLEVKDSRLTIEVKPVRNGRQEPIEKPTTMRRQRTLASKPVIVAEIGDEASDKRRWRRR